MRFIVNLHLLFLLRTSSNTSGGLIPKDDQVLPCSTDSPPKNNKRRPMRENRDRQMFDHHHRHKKLLKTRSHTHQQNSSTKRGWDECNDRLNFDPTSFQGNLCSTQMRQPSAGNKKKCSHKNISELESDHRNVISNTKEIPVENICTLTNDLLTKNLISADTNSVSRAPPSKQPLKKSNTFPYEKLHSDNTSSCSSENEGCDIGCDKGEQKCNASERMTNHMLRRASINHDIDGNVFLDETENIRKR